MKARSPEERLPFSEDEMFRALRLLLDDQQAREIAEVWAATPDRIRSGEAIGWGLTEDTYILLSLLGGDTARRVEQGYLVGLSADERARFERQRDHIRASLENDGKL